MMMWGIITTTAALWSVKPICGFNVRSILIRRRQLSMVDRSFGSHKPRRYIQTLSFSSSELEQRKQQQPGPKTSSKNTGCIVLENDDNGEIIDGDGYRPFFCIYYNDVYKVDLPPGHRFPMGKYEKVRKRVQYEITKLQEQQQPKSEQQVRCEFSISPLATIEQLETTHCSKYIQRFMKGNITELEQRNVGFPWSLQGVNRSLSSVGGTVAAAITVCTEWEKRCNIHQNQNYNNDKQGSRSLLPLPPWGGHIAGGTHHAFYDYGEGFCVFSDIAVAANVVLRKFSSCIHRVLIIDLDVHQGNGNAVLFQNNDNVLTFSIHSNGNYFSQKQQSDLDIELPIGCTDETYITTLRHWLKQLKKLHEETDRPFDLVFYQAGVDVIKEDRLGKMHLTSKGVQKRNELVYEFVHTINAPMIITMGGGYPKNQNEWEPIIDAHSNVYIQAYQFLTKKYNTKTT